MHNVKLDSSVHLNKMWKEARCAKILTEDGVVIVVLESMEIFPNSFLNNSYHFDMVYCDIVSLIIWGFESILIKPNQGEAT